MEERKGKERKIETYLPRRKLLKQNHLSTLMHLFPPLYAFAHQLPRGQPSLRGVIHSFPKLFSRQFTRDEKFLVEDLVVRGLVPSGVQGGDAGGEIRFGAVEGDAGESGDPVIDAVEGFDEILIDFGIESFNGGMIEREIQQGGENGGAKVSVVGERRRGSGETYL